MKIVTFTLNVDTDDFSHAVEDAREIIAHADIHRGKVLKGKNITIEVKEPYTPKTQPVWKPKKVNKK